MARLTCRHWCSRCSLDLYITRRPPNHNAFRGARKSSLPCAAHTPVARSHFVSAYVRVNNRLKL